MSRRLLDALCRAGDPHRLADGHRGRLLHLAGDAEFRSGPSRHRLRRAASDAPKTAFGLIVAGLKRRRAAGVAPFTVMSCDNIPGNGHVTENAVAGLAELADPELAALDSARTSPFPIPWSTASRRRRPTANARFCATHSASRTIGRSSAKNSASGWWRTSSLPGGRRWRRSASRSRRTSRRMN